MLYFVHCLTGRGRTSTVLAALSCWTGGDADLMIVNGALDQKFLSLHTSTCIPSSRHLLHHPATAMIYRKFFVTRLSSIGGGKHTGILVIWQEPNLKPKSFLQPRSTRIIRNHAKMKMTPKQQQHTHKTINNNLVYFRECSTNEEWGLKQGIF